MRGTHHSHRAPTAAAGDTPTTLIDGSPPTPADAPPPQPQWLPMEEENEAEAAPRTADDHSRNAPRTRWWPARCGAAWRRWLGRAAAAVRRTVCRIDVCWALLYLLLLMAIGAVALATSETNIEHALLDSWDSLHHNRVASLQIFMDQGTERMHTMAVNFLSLHAHDGPVMQSQRTLSVLCAIFADYNMYEKIISFIMLSFTQYESISCIRASPNRTPGQRALLSGAVSVDHIVNASYYVNPSTYTFDNPPRVFENISAEAANITDALVRLRDTSPLLQRTLAYWAGTVDEVDPRLQWSYNARSPHLLSYMCPAGLLFRGLTLPPSLGVLDAVLLRLDGSMLADVPPITATGALLAVLVNASLTSGDPRIMSGNWGQPTLLSSMNLFAALATPATYLRARDVDHPLMRAALRRVDFAAMTQHGYNRSVTFRYGGAYATVTACMLTTMYGMAIPVVLVSEQESVTGPYLDFRDAAIGLASGAVALVALGFWFFVRVYFALPLRRMARLLNRSVQRGSRALYRGGRRGIGALTEVQALGNAHNAAMRRLREIDAFVPTAVAALLHPHPAPDAAAPAGTEAADAHAHAHAHTSAAAPQSASQPVDAGLRPHLSTAVYVTVLPGAAAGSVVPLLPTPASRREARLAAVVEQAAQAVGTAHCGPFRSPAAVEAFAGAVHELAAVHHGTMLRLCPDASLLHFHSAVRAHTARHAQPQPQQQQRPGIDSDRNDASDGVRNDSGDAVLERCAAQDAHDAAAFALALTSWVHHVPPADGAAPAMPDVRVLLDTAVFSCGQYRPAASEQTITVALGRDALRDAGSVVRRIGLRVAMTADTAARVQAEVRQIPVEALDPATPGAPPLVLYEALPGRVGSGADAWLPYARCCADGFAHMRRGDYAGALRAYRGVADIADLEPGLLPPSLSREAARSDVRGGAVSTQVARLMRECDTRVRCGCGDVFVRVARRRPGVDAVAWVRAGGTRSPPPPPPAASAAPPPAASSSAAAAAAAAAAEDERRRPASRAAARVVRRRTRQAAALDRAAAAAYPPARERRVVEVSAGLRAVVPTPPPWVCDNLGVRWLLPINDSYMAEGGKWKRRVRALSSAGAIATVYYLSYHDVHPFVAKLIREAPLGPMSDALRSRVPVCVPSDAQKAAIRSLLLSHQALCHPNILRPDSFSHSVEGGVVTVWPVSPGGTLRQLLERYRTLKAETLMRFGLQILSALCYLHDRGLAHGHLHLDNVLIDSTGRCRLMGQSASHRLARQTFVVDCFACLSPHTATGALPTPACDMFCYGLLLLEAITRKPPWRWATSAGTTTTSGANAAAPLDDTETSASSAKELKELMTAPGRAFADAVVQGRVVPHVELMEAVVAAKPGVRSGWDIIVRLLSMDPAARPTAAELRQLNVERLRQAGLMVEDDNR